MKNDRFATLVGTAALVLAAGLPLLALAPFGWLWLWQNGYWLHWLAGALVVSISAFALRAWALARIRRSLATKADESPAESGQGSPREIAARAEVARLARDVDPALLRDRDAVFRLGLETVEAVARTINPTIEQPMWSFTVPEALTLIERVARRLRPAIVENVPLGDRLTVGQMLSIYRWRTLAGTASAAYDLWRIVRMVNPVSAVTQEIRERLSKSMMEGLKDELGKRLAARYVTEVGDAAIELYSGRLVLAHDQAAGSDVADLASPADEKASGPLRFLLAGRTGSGKSSLVNALAAEVRAATDTVPQTRERRAYEVQQPGFPPVALIDTPGLGAPADIPAIVAAAAEADLVLWVVPADRPDRDLDRAALAAIGQAFAENRHRSAPPIVGVVTHIDRLRPFGEWNPPYDIAEPSSPKAQAIRAAVDAVAEDLALPAKSLVPVCLDAGKGLTNVDLVWARIASELPAAKGAQLLRRVAAAQTGMDWRRLLNQAIGAGRLVTSVFTEAGNKPRTKS